MVTPYRFFTQQTFCHSSFLSLCLGLINLSNFFPESSFTFIQGLTLSYLPKHSFLYFRPQPCLCCLHHYAIEYKKYFFTLRPSGWRLGEWSFDAVLLSPFHFGEQTNNDSDTRLSHRNTTRITRYQRRNPLFSKLIMSPQTTCTVTSPLYQLTIQAKNKYFHNVLVL